MQASQPGPAFCTPARVVASSLLLLLLVSAPIAVADSLRPWAGGAKTTFRIEELGTRAPRGPADYRGDILLVHFWATYCAPCVTELPALQRLATRGAARGLRVMTISVAEADPRVGRFRDTTGLTLPVLMDRDRKVTKAWKVDALPTTYVLDRTGRPRLYIEQDHDWDSVDPAALAARLDGPASSPKRPTQSKNPGGSP